jgi:Protein of unknown function (DUF 659)
MSCFFFLFFAVANFAFLLFLFLRRAKETIAGEVETYGFCLLGDGATVRGMPLMNVLATTPSGGSVLDIIDCTEHLEDGGKKDAKYIASIFDDHIQELDPKGLYLNAVIFDGASNVQKAGRVLEAKYPQVSVLHGVEHCVSLFFADLSKLGWIEYAIINYRRVYRVFGSGSMHAPYAIFRKQAQTFNGGVKIGLVRAADTRMAGYFYALHRMLRLKPALEATVASAEFVGLKLTNALVTQAVAFITDREMWKALHCVLRCLFPALRVLRLADKSDPGFDCLYYFIRKADKAMEWSVRSFESIDHFQRTTVARSENRWDDGNGDDEFMDMIEMGHESDGEGEGLSDEDSNLNDLPSGNGGGKQLGSDITFLWNKRKRNMVSDFCIAGWMLSPLEDVMLDVSLSRASSLDTTENNSAMDRILAKFYHDRTEEELGEVMDTFWTEYDAFTTKTGQFGSHRRYIWNSELLRKRHSAKWHAQYSVPFTKVSFILFVCFVLFLMMH